MNTHQLAGLFAFIGWSVSAQAAVVYPTGNSVKDVKSLQAAVDLGGTITLKARNAKGAPQRFELGDAGILLTRDVVISGETVGGAQTEIYGGLDALHNLVFDEQDNPLYPDLNVTVGGIHFNGPGGSAVTVFGGNDVTIANNRVSNAARPAARAGIRVGASHGVVQVVGNQVGDPATPLANPYGVGILISPTGGTVLVAGNVVTTGPADGFGWTIRVVASGGSIEVTDNIVYTTNPGGTGIRISNPAGQTKVEQNEIHMDLASVDPSNPGSDIGAIVVNATDNVYVADNRILGTSFCGLCLYGSSHCTLVRNDLSGLLIPAGLVEGDYAASSADLVFGLFQAEEPPAPPLAASFNMAVGAYTVSDAGKGNVVVGATAATHGIATAGSSRAREP